MKQIELIAGLETNAQVFVYEILEKHANGAVFSNEQRSKVIKEIAVELPFGHTSVWQSDLERLAKDHKHVTAQEVKELCQQNQ